jgi:hypothetical protein
MPIPEKLSETITELQREVNNFIPTTDEEKEYVKALVRLLGWFDELHSLKTDNVTALENCLDALGRIYMSREALTKEDERYDRKLKKLMNDIQGVVKHEIKFPSEQEPTTGKEEE